MPEKIPDFKMPRDEDAGRFSSRTRAAIKALLPSQYGPTCNSVVASFVLVQALEEFRAQIKATIDKVEAVKGEAASEVPPRLVEAPAILRGISRKADRIQVLLGDFSKEIETMYDEVSKIITDTKNP